MPIHLFINKDIKKSSLNKTQQRRLKELLTQRAIEDESLKAILIHFFNSMKENLTELEVLHAHILTQDHFTVSAVFQKKLDDARDSYQEVFEKHFKSTVENAKKIDNLGGVISFVVNFLETAIDTLIEAKDTHDKFANFLDEREDEVKQSKLEEVERYRTQAYAIRQRIRSDWSHAKEQIDTIQVDQAQKEEAIRIINREQDTAQTLDAKLIDALNSLRDHIQAIDIDMISFVRNSLPHQLMADFLLHSGKEGPRSSKVFSLWTGVYPLKQLKTFFFHGLREGHIKAHFLEDIVNKLDLNTGKTLLSSNPKIKNYQLACLSAVLKRFPIADYQAERFDYYIMKALIKRALELIRTPALDIDETLELISSQMMCEVDLKAHYNLPLKQEVPFRNHFFNHSRFGANKHLALKAVLEAHFTLMTEAREKSEKGDLAAERDMLKEAETIHNIVHQIITFYGEGLVNAYWESPLVKDAIENESGLYGREERFKEDLTLRIEAEVVKLLNNELLDATPSAYYCAPLCGLSQFLTQLGGEGKITVSINADKHFQVTYSGDGFKPLEAHNPQPKTLLKPRRQAHAKPQVARSPNAYEGRQAQSAALRKPQELPAKQPQPYMPPQQPVQARKTHYRPHPPHTPIPQNRVTPRQPVVVASGTYIPSQQVRSAPSQDISQRPYPVANSYPITTSPVYGQRPIHHHRTVTTHEIPRNNSWDYDF